MKKYSARLFIGFLTLAVMPAFAEARTHLLIFSGQSNMKHLNAEKSVLPTLKAAFPGDEFWVVHYAISGQPIRRWYLEWKPAEGPSEELKGRNRPPGDMYKTLMGMVAETMQGKPEPDTITFYWMQGEADTHTAAQWNVYAKSLTAVIAQLRNDLKRPDLGFVVGRISDYKDFPPEGAKVIREALVSVAEKDPLGAWVDTDDLNGNGDGLHYNAAGYQKLGERFAEKTVQLYKKNG